MLYRCVGLISPESLLQSRSKVSTDRSLQIAQGSWEAAGAHGPLCT